MDPALFLEVSIYCSSAHVNCRSSLIHRRCSEVHLLYLQVYTMTTGRRDKEDKQQ